jgi:hypothetical protein
MPEAFLFVGSDPHAALAAARLEIGNLVIASRVAEKQSSSTARIERRTWIASSAVSLLAMTKFKVTHAPGIASPRPPD